MALQHGHDPKHAFVPVVEDAKLEPLAYALLEPGRNAGHHAICDGCDKVWNALFEKEKSSNII